MFQLIQFLFIYIYVYIYFYFYSYLITEGDRWVYERGCDRKDKPQFNGEAQFYWCTTDYCNAAENHQPKLLVTLLFASLFLFKLWRF